MNQKLRFPIVGSEPIKFGSKMPNFLLFKFACPTTDYQLLTSRFLRFSVFIGQQ